MGLLWWLKMDLIINCDAFDRNWALHLRSIDCSTVFAHIPMEHHFNWTGA